MNEAMESLAKIMHLRFPLTPHALRLRVCAMFTRRSLGVGGWCREVYPPEPWRRRALPVLRSPARWDAGGCGMLLWVWMKFLKGKEK